MVKINVKIDGLEKLIEGVKKAPIMTTDLASRAINQSIAKINSNAIKEAPHYKGQGGGTLKQLIRHKMITKLTGVVESLAKYSIYVHEGTKPSIGRFVPGLGSDGKGRRLKTGIHPGQKANPFFIRAIEKSKKDIEGYFEEVLKKVSGLFKI